MENPKIEFLGDLQRLEIKEGDRFVLTIDEIISDQALSRITGYWNTIMGDVPLIILQKGWKLGVIRDEKAG